MEADRLDGMMVAVSLMALPPQTVVSGKALIRGREVGDPSTVIYEFRHQRLCDLYATFSGSAWDELTFDRARFRNRPEDAMFQLDYPALRRRRVSVAFGDLPFSSVICGRGFSGQGPEEREAITFAGELAALWYFLLGAKLDRLEISVLAV